MKIAKNISVLLLCLTAVAIATLLIETRADDTAAEKSAAGSQITPVLVLTGEPLSLDEDRTVLKFYSNIPTPVGPSVETQKRSVEPRDAQKGSER